MESYQKELSEVYSIVNGNECGLTSAEAAARLLSQGKNALKEGKKKSKILLFFTQFKDLMSIILICAAVLSGVLAFVTGDSRELADTAILLFIILLNAVVGFLQQYRADSALEKLKKMSGNTAKVVRDKKLCVLPAQDLVTGDIIELEEGDRIPADCRIIACENFACDESSLTGESKPVKKHAGTVKKTAISLRTNSAFSSCFCVKGWARCLVTGTGMNTEVGKIATLLDGKAPPSPMDKIIAKLGKIITATVLSVALVLFLGGILSHRVSFLQNVMSAVAVAVAAIPEGMGAVVTIILAMGMQRMAKSRAVIRKLSAVETLGGCTCICSDKTGTLTQNKMTVEEIKTDFTTSAQEIFARTPLQERLLTCMRVCHTVKGSAGSYVGDGTEIALVEYADRARFFLNMQTLGGIPFSSARKMMSVVGEIEGKRKLFVKGGADVLLKKCACLATPDGEVALTLALKKKILEEVENNSLKAMRVLAFAEGEYRGEIKEEGLTFLGFVAMLDPPKEGAQEAVSACKKAGIRTVMITGDSPQTAFAIAKRLGIAKNMREVITGEELEELGEEYFRRVKRYSVYARVSPKHKSEIVRALQGAGEVVAMTGDGVNDAPSIQAADVGVAMGSGTDVTKNAADMVITDDDFSTVVHAVEEGRNVFYNVKKTIAFFLATNLAEVLSVLVATLFLWKYDFLTSTQLLWINLITDSLPVLALGVERTAGAMDGEPVKERDIFCKRSLFLMAFYALAQSALTVGLFTFALPLWGNEVASTLAFLTMSLLELFHVFNVRMDESKRPFQTLFQNGTLWLTVAIGVAANVLLVLVPPFATAFRLSVLTPLQWLCAAGTSLAVLPLGAAVRLVSNCLRRRVKRCKKRSPVRESAQ